MIPLHCRQGREQRTVLIRQAPLSGKILKGMLAIVVNCMELHLIPNAAGMCYLSWIGEISILSVCVLFLWVMVVSLHSVFIPQLECISHHMKHLHMFLLLSEWYYVNIHTQLSLISPTGFYAFSHLTEYLKEISLSGCSVLSTVPSREA